MLPAGGHREKWGSRGARPLETPVAAHATPCAPDSRRGGAGCRSNKEALRSGQGDSAASGRPLSCDPGDKKRELPPPGSLLGLVRREARTIGALFTFSELGGSHLGPYSGLPRTLVHPFCYLSSLRPPSCFCEGPPTRRCWGDCWEALKLRALRVVEGPR